MLDVDNKHSNDSPIPYAVLQYDIVRSMYDDEGICHNCPGIWPICVLLWLLSNQE